MRREATTRRTHNELSGGHLETALEQWKAHLGSDNVVLDPASLRAVETATFATKITVPAIVRPGNREEVRQVLRIANKWRIPVYPVSGGCNWGYGSRVPSASGWAGEILLRHGFEPSISLTMITERSLACVISITYDRHVPGEDEKASTCHHELLRRLTDSGFYCCRMTSQTSAGLQPSPDYDSVLRSLKRNLDPNQILAPGRYFPAE